MNEYKKAELFNHDLDRIMEGKPPSGIEDPDSQQLLNLASILKETDFSGERNTQERLRRQLRKTCREKHRNNKEGIMKKIFGQRRAVAVSASLAIMFMLTVSLIFPGTVTAVADSMGDKISKIFKLGPYCTIIQVNDPEPGTVAVKKGAVSGEQEVSVDEDEDITIKYASIEEAQKTASFTILTPAYLPAPYEFKEAEGYKGSGDYINLYFQGNGKKIILRERAMNENTQYVAGSNTEIQEVEINGTSGVLGGSSLTWDKDGINCSLFFKGLDTEEALKIARSIE